MTRTLKLVLLFAYIFTFLQADVSVDAVETLKKRKFDYAFMDDVTVTEKKTVNPKTDLQNRSFQLESALRAKLRSKTGEHSLRSISDYEIENYPKCISVFRDVWDERALEELEAAIPLLEFKKKPADWRPKPNMSDRENLSIVGLKPIYDELLGRLNDQNNTNFSKIKWADFDIIGWPEGVYFNTSVWKLKHILAIYRNLDFINFVPKNHGKSLNIEETTLNRALNINYQIMDKFELCTLNSRKNIKMYKFKPWPTCVPQSFKYWDKEAVEEIEEKLNDLEFIPKPPDWQKYTDRLSLQNELQDEILKAVDKQLGVPLTKFPWQDINISNWPEGILKMSNFRSKMDTLLLYRALPNMQFTWKSDDSKWKYINKNAEALKSQLEASIPSCLFLIEPQIHSKAYGDDFRSVPNSDSKADDDVPEMRASDELFDRNYHNNIIKGSIIDDQLHIETTFYRPSSIILDSLGKIQNDI